MRLRHRVQFNRQGPEADDGYGNVVAEFEPLFSVWGNLRETTGKERVDAGTVEGVRTATIRVRKNAATMGLTGADQAIARGETWNLADPSNVADNDAYLDILATAGGAQ
ncbi:MAG: phage head closure protein [Sulfitobacter sp.]